MDKQPSLKRSARCRDRNYAIEPSALPSVAVFAPYSRQVDMLIDLRPSGITVNSIDGFQGREADVVVFVTTRCNAHADIGFLEICAG